MKSIKYTELIEDVKQVLLSALRIKASNICYLSAYQIVERLPPPIRSRLFGQKATGGKRIQHAKDAVEMVSSAASMIPGVITAYMDCSGMKATVAGIEVEPSHQICALYRLDSRQARMER